MTGIELAISTEVESSGKDEIGFKVLKKYLTCSHFLKISDNLTVLFKFSKRNSKETSFNSCYP